MLSSRTVPSWEVLGRSRDGTGRDRTGPRDLEVPVVLAGQDLETLKVLWSRGPGTKEVQKVPRTKNWKSPGTMETLIGINVFISKKERKMQLPPTLDHFHSSEVDTMDHQ